MGCSFIFVGFIVYEREDLRDRWRKKWGFVGFLFWYNDIENFRRLCKVNYLTPCDILQVLEVIFLDVLFCYIDASRLVLEYLCLFEGRP